MSKLILFLTYFAIGILPTNVLAKMGSLFPEPEGKYGSSGGVGIEVILFILILLWLVYIAYADLFHNFKEWGLRRERGEKKSKLVWNKKIFLIILFLSFFLSLPVLVWIQKYGIEYNRLADSIFVYVVSVFLFYFFRR